ncbi:MAG: hypothetical protein ACXU8N_16905 [Telluria sp.]
MAEKVLLLQGPLHYRGINPITQNLFTDKESRAKGAGHFSADQTILAMALVFRGLGFKIVYSGWTDDAAWFDDQAALFDHVVLSDQSQLASQSVFKGEVIPNNKEKLYYAAWRGMQKVVEAWGEEPVVFRLRSDIAVDYRCALAEAARLAPGSRELLVEYYDTKRAMWMNDFMQIARAGVLLAVYRELTERSLSNQSFHVSSHVDHYMTYFKLYNDGALSRLLCMNRAMYDSVVWRGIPRYMETVFPAATENLFFGGALEFPTEHSFEAVYANLDPAARGTRVPPQSAA